MATKKCPYCAEEIQQEALKCRFCGSWLADPSGQPVAPSYAGPPDSTGGRRLMRPLNDRVMLGVCSGIAYSMGLDPTVIRIVYALTTFFTAIVPGIFLYFILALIIPSEPTPAA
jgi:phage shock protein C